jgi:hypothetical protein
MRLGSLNTFISIFRASMLSLLGSTQDDDDLLVVQNHDTFK